MKHQLLLDNDDQLDQKGSPTANEGTNKKKGSLKRFFKKGERTQSSSSRKQLSASKIDSSSRSIAESCASAKQNEQQLSQQEQITQVFGDFSGAQVAQDSVFGNSSSRPIDGDTLQPIDTPQKKKPPISMPSHTPRRRGDGKSWTRKALAREFGRASLPPKLARNWVVEVSPAEWDGDENQWKYRILVQRREFPKSRELDTVSSFTNAFTWRTIADFCWLENALRAEYHGALMLPLLSIAIGTADLEHTQYEVEANLLRDWLGDVFNGIRGQGEVLLDMGSIDLLSSEAMEAFLYRNTDPLPTVDPRGADLLNKSMLPSTSSLDLPWKDGPEKVSWKDSEDDSFVNSLFTKPFSWLPIDSMCARPTSPDHTEQQHVQSNRKSSPALANRIPLEMINCSSRAVGDTATLEVQDSFVDFSASPQHHFSSKLAIHSELLEAEKDLVSSYRGSAMASMEKLRVLSEEEAQIGAAWKRFAIALSNLFAFEKEVESTRIGEKERKEHMPYRKLRKRDVEDCLRVMARQRMDRATPSLRVLSMMLSAYVGDLSAVEPAVNAYSQAVVHLAGLDEAVTNGYRQKHKKAPENGDCSTQWHEQLKALASMQFGEVKKQFAGTSGTSEHTATTATSSTDMENVAAQQKRAFEERVLANERLLRQFVTSLCRASPIRVARMAWKYFKMESAQAVLLKGASISMRTKVNIASPNSLVEMAKKHEQEDREDDIKEVELLQRIVDIGNNKKYSSNPQQSSVSGSESDASSEYEHEDEDDEEEKALLREKALEIAQERLGLWDAKLALSIMEAVGISDAEVRVEETTRELRLVRKHAIGLRENLSRCIEAVDILTSVILEGNEQTLASVLTSDDEVHEKREKNRREGGNRIRETRQDFITEISSLFSGSPRPIEPSKRFMPKSASPSVSVLSGAGIDTSDPAGWRTALVANDAEEKNEKWESHKSRGQCGKTALSYVNKMDAGVEVILGKISEILEEYQERVEGIESFVYMHCVGIQLEKHCSQKRSQALAAWEKKTDITTAINIAKRKKLPLLVNELQAKLDNITPRNVSHTTVKETKEMHLLSKNLKAELQDLANRRFLRARETATHRVVALMTLWAKYEEVSASVELKALGEVIEEIERTVKDVDIPGYLLDSS